MVAWHFSSYEVAVFGVAILLLAGHVLVMLRISVRDDWWLLARSTAAALKAAVTQQFQRTPVESLSEFETIVSQKMWKDRFALCRIANGFYVTCFMVYTGGVVFNLLKNVHARATIVDHRYELYRGAQQDEGSGDGCAQ